MSVKSKTKELIILKKEIRTVLHPPNMHCLYLD